MRPSCEPWLGLLLFLRVFFRVFFLRPSATQLYVRDLDGGVPLTVARMAPVAGLAAGLVDGDLGPLALSEHLADDQGLRQLRLRRACLPLVVDDQQRREFDRFVRALDALDLDH